jgi:hypothetical protein
MSFFTGTYFGRVGKDISSCAGDLTCALQLSDLSFDASAEPIKDIRGNVIARHQNIARADTGASLGVMGAGYAITQPKIAFKYLSGLPGGVNYRRGGILKGGRFFLSAEFDTFTAGGDQMTAFGVFLSSFDGSWANRIVWLLGRHACLNLCRFEIGSATVNKDRAGRAAKHTLNHEIKLDSFILNLHMAQDNLAKEIDKLSRKAVTANEFQVLTERIVPGDSGKAENIRAELADLFNRPDMGTNGATLWDAFNSFSSYDTHHATRRATTVASSEENAFSSLIEGRGYADKVLPALLEMAQ